MQIVDALSRIVGESESEMWKLTFSLMQMVGVHLSVLISIFGCPVAAFCTFLVTDCCAHCTASKIQGYKLQCSHHTDIPYSVIASLLENLKHCLKHRHIALCNWLSFSYSNVQFMAEIRFKLIHNWHLNTNWKPSFATLKWWSGSRSWSLAPWRSGAFCSFLQWYRYLRVSVFVPVLILAMIQYQALVTSKHYLVETKYNPEHDLGLGRFFFLENIYRTQVPGHRALKTGV